MAKLSLIVFENVSKWFIDGNKQVHAVDNFNLSVNKGEFVCLVGASGCGKSTLLNMVAGFTSPSRGRILLNDEPISGIDPRCGMIFQNYALFPWKTVLGNVEFGMKMKRIPKRQRQKEALKYIEMVGLTGFEDSYPSELSGGMRQRVTIARALANDPEILLMDEPFAALDAMTRQVLQEELLRIVDESNKTTLFITHSIDEALLLADRVIIMSARPGRVKQDLTIDLPRPRHVADQLSERYLELKNTIWSSVEEEVLQNILLSEKVEATPKRKRKLA